MSRLKKITWILLLLSAALIKLVSLRPAWIEEYYSTGVYRYISAVQRVLLGWLPFSIGDLLYAAAVLYVLVKITRVIKLAVKKQLFKGWYKKAAWKVLYIALWVYVLFNALWGLNYNRLGIAQQLQLDIKTYSTGEVMQLMTVLVQKLNSTYAGSLPARDSLTRKKNLFSKAAGSYGQAASQMPFLAYQARAVKPSLYSYLGNYFGYSGYYNPFTGEAQVNTTVPVFIQPFTTCHEIGHQLGYAKENEANFAGFLSAKASTDTAFLYSLYFDLYTYGIRDLYQKDTALAKGISNQLLPGVKNDFLCLRQFYSSYSTPLEPLIRKMYGQFLKANEQPVGMMSYNEVIGMVLAYTRRYGVKAL